MKNRALAIVGTASNVGKSSIAAAIMNYYSAKGFTVVPFKALNVTSNIGFSKENLPMAQSQIWQAYACNVEASIYFNPILIKPTSKAMEMYLNGHLVVRDYDNLLLEECISGYNKLNNENDLVVIEGSGSCVELNLKEKDLANFPLINKIGVPTLLVTNIENCGVFASLYGTISLLNEKERSLIKGIIINKYCGAVEYFNDAKKIIEEITEKPVIGIVSLDDNSSNIEEMWQKIIKGIDMKKLHTIIMEGYDV